MDHLPPCCASCPELVPQAGCRLLADPTPPNRTRLFTMPCDVRRLLRQRLRGHGEEVVERALAVWSDPTRASEDVAQKLDRTQLDARAWLGPWPFLALVLPAIPSDAADAGASPYVPAGAGDSTRALPLVRALLELRRIDPAALALVIDAITNDFDPASWRAALGTSDAQLFARRALAVYRLLVLRFDVLGSIERTEARVALATRRFGPGDPSDAAALRSTRSQLGDASLTMADWRSLYREGVLASLDVLATRLADWPNAWTEGTEAALRRALRVDRDSLPPAGGTELQDDLTRDQGIFDGLRAEARIAGDAGAPGELQVHVPRARLVDLCTTGAEASADEANAVVRHLFVCDDGRCAALLRAEAAGREAVRTALTSPMSEPPPGPGAGLMQSMGHASPRLVRCRDVLWETFAAMAKAEGRTMDDLVEDAMDRYRLLRDHVRSETDPPSSATRSSRPPPSGGLPSSARFPSSPPPGSGRSTGLHFSNAAPRRPSQPPSSESEELTEPRRVHPLAEVTRPMRASQPPQAALDEIGDDERTPPLK